MKWQAVWQRLQDMYNVMMGYEPATTERLREQVRPKVRTLAENFEEYRQLNKALRAAYDEQVKRLQEENTELRETLRRCGYRGRLAEATPDERCNRHSTHRDD